MSGRIIIPGKADHLIETPNDNQGPPKMTVPPRAQMRQLMRSMKRAGRRERRAINRASTRLERVQRGFA